MKLDKEQESAVYSLANDRVVIAGPGSGKTEVIVAAVAHEAERIGAKHCCVVTYTNAAAREFRARLKGRGAIGLGWCGTAHALALALCRTHHALLGLPAKLTVLDDDQQRTFMEAVCGEIGIGADHVPAAIKLLHCSDTYYLLKEKSKASMTKAELAVWHYVKRMRESGLLSFRSVLSFGASVASRAKWCMSLFVDEAQDAAPEDWQFYDALPAKRRMMVGDPDQSVFGWRGADSSKLESGVWSTAFTVAHVLERNYRSARFVCVAANNLIKHNARTIAKQTVSLFDTCQCVFAAECKDELDELNRVVGEVKLNQGKGTVAVLARTNRLAQQVAAHLRQERVEVSARPDGDAPDWAAAKLMLAAHANPDSDFLVHAWLRVAKGHEVADAMRGDAAMAMVGVGWLAGIDRDTSIEAFLGKLMSGAARNRFAAAVQQLGAGATLDELLMHVEREPEQAPHGPGVTVCTVHAAKGREWDTVLVVGCEEGTFPTDQALRAPSKMEEERRLMYVAITRARKKVVLSWCRLRGGWSGGEMEPKQPSRFLQEALP